MVSARLSGLDRELFEVCREYLDEVKRKAGLIAETNQAEVIKHALKCMDEKHGITRPRQSPKRAV
jgi:hypothetical protein